MDMSVQEIVLFALSGLLLALIGWRYQRGQHQQAVLLLLASAFALRLGMAGLDPFQHNWDERYHALVAKNLLAAWARPQLRANPVLAYDYCQWC